ncbi:hypothetical protein [Rickettsia endosymbiont of Polydrusus tereticollis]
MTSKIRAMQQRQPLRDLAMTIPGAILLNIKLILHKFIFYCSY